jgi:hypothetical protein
MSREGKSLWCNRRESDVDRLNALIPSSGPVDTSDGKNKALEYFRLFQNGYYDIFNNGGGNWDNKGEGFRKVARAFGLSTGLSLREIKWGIDLSGSKNDYFYEPLERLGDIVIDMALSEQFEPAAA